MRALSIYLAGPLFNIAEREFNRILAQALRADGHHVFMPQEHEQRNAGAADIYRRDLAALERAELVLANMDGPDPDSGTCWECGYAVGKGKNVVVFRTDFRAGDDPRQAPYNLMLKCSASDDIYRPELANDELQGLIDEIRRRLEKYGPDPI